MTEITVCPVCLNNINGNYGFCNVNCEHIYCMECMLKSTCPICSLNKSGSGNKNEVVAAYEQGKKDGLEQSKAELNELREKYEVLVELFKHKLKKNK